MKPSLLDVNVLVALAWPSHIHHDVAHAWFQSAHKSGWATCLITQSALLRLSSNPKILPDAVSLPEALVLLEQMVAMETHEYWSDEFPISAGVVFKKGHVIGHRQITDAHLYSLAIHRDARLVTFDKGIRQLYPVAAEEHLLVLESE